MKLSEAYASEKNAVGNFAAIGYKDPGAGNEHKTSNFDYSGQVNADGQWDAVSLVGLNDCAKGKKWLLKVAYDETSGNLTTTVGSDDTGNCISPLTPNFCNLATGGSCTLTSL